MLQCYCGNKPARRGWSALLKLRTSGAVSTRGRRRRCRVLCPLHTGHPFLIHAGLSSGSCVGLEILVRMRAAWGARVPLSPPGARYGLTDAAGRAMNLRGTTLPPIRTADRAECEGVISWGRRRGGLPLTKTYRDPTLLKMPEDFPLPIEPLGSGANWLAVAGKVSGHQRLLPVVRSPPRRSSGVAGVGGRRLPMFRPE